MFYLLMCLFLVRIFLFRASVQILAVIPSISRMVPHKTFTMTTSFPLTLEVMAALIKLIEHELTYHISTDLLMMRVGFLFLSEVAFLTLDNIDWALFEIHCEKHTGSFH